MIHTDYGSFDVDKLRYIWLVTTERLGGPKVMCVAATVEELLLVMDPCIMGVSRSQLTAVKLDNHYRFTLGQSVLVMRAWQVGEAAKGSIPGTLMVGVDTADLYSSLKGLRTIPMVT